MLAISGIIKGDPGGRGGLYLAKYMNVAHRPIYANWLKVEMTQMKDMTILYI